MRFATVIIWADERLHRVSRGRVSLVGIAGLPSLRLTTVGRKSGQPRSANLLYFPHDGGFVLVGSNWGRSRDPGWTFNLRAHPDAVVAIRGRDIPVTATPVKGERYHELWRGCSSSGRDTRWNASKRAGNCRSSCFRAANSRFLANRPRISDLDGIGGNLA